MSRRPDSLGARRYLVPEVVQTSAMDCGPAALKCLLEGFGIGVSYGRLREACQTDVDGTSIGTVEQVARDLGLEAEQVMLPLDHLLLAEAEALPAIVVVRIASGFTHFVVAWQRHPGLVQVMDPATGRRWPSTRAFLDEVYVHSQLVPAAAWREWAGSESNALPLLRRLADLGIDGDGKGGDARRLLAAARADPGHLGLAVLDAATRMTRSLVAGGAIRRGREAAGVIAAFSARALDPATGAGAIPAAYWSVRPAPPAGGVEQLALRGAVLVKVKGRRPETAPARASGTGEGRAEAPRRLARDLVRALEQTRTSPLREVLRLLLADGRSAPLGVALAVLPAAATVVAEALLFRGLIDLGRDLGLYGQRLTAAVLMLLFLAASLLLRLPLHSAVQRLGRRLEVGLRAAFLAKLPRLGDRYFSSRLASDMAERAHALHRLRALPLLAFDLLSTGTELALTAAGIVWLAPRSAPLVLLALAAATLVPLLLQPVLIERDLRVRNHGGALARFYLDALLGLVAVRTHGAERAVRREHESLLVTWAEASRGLLRAAIAVEALGFLTGFGLAALLLFDHLGHGGGAGSVLLLVYWTLNLPVQGERLALALRQYPPLRNTTLRLLEPLGAPDETLPDEIPPAAALPPVAGAAAIELRGVTVRSTGHVILEQLDLTVRAAEHVAIVGPSGAGKSTLVGLLLGWNRAAAGEIRVDGAPLDAARLEALRRQTAWLDPAVQLWNRSLLENLLYGAAPDPGAPIGHTIEQAELRSVLEKLPDGLQSTLGEGGGLVSGGEGQRIRFGRALLRGGVRLVLLDEPFRGLDRELRRELLARARVSWRGATLVCVTHDVGETLEFPRVLVLEHGRIVEDAPPRELEARPGSRYRELLDAERDVRERLWSGPGWRRLRLEQGVLREAPGEPA